MSLPFRFSAQIQQPVTGREWAETARKVEGLGYSALTMSDHFGDQLSPLAGMMAAADATTTLRIGTLVFDNDYRHPLVLAKEAATIDLLSDGRVELGLGAGWMRSDYEGSGIPYDSPGVRIDRFEEAIAVIKGLMADGPFTFEGKHYTITGHEGTPKPVQRPHPPLIIGGGGPRVLGIAGREADIVSINANLKDGLGGAETAPNLAPAVTAQKVQWARDGARDRWNEIEVHALVGFCVFTDDPMSIAGAMAPAFGITPAEALHVPAGLIGTVDSMVEELEWRREEWGISYITVEGPWEEFAPVVSRLAGA